MGLAKSSPGRREGAGRATLAAVLVWGWALRAEPAAPPPARPAPEAATARAEVALGGDAVDPPARPEPPPLPESPVEEEVEPAGWIAEEGPGDFLEPFVWPETPGPAAASFAPALLSEDPLFTHEFLGHVRAVTAGSPVLDFMNSFLSGPQLLLDSGADLLLQGIPRPDPDADDRPVVFRLFDLRISPDDSPIFTSFLNAWMLREQSFFAGFAESEMNTVAFEDGTGEIQEDYLRDRQRKLLWDALRRSYLSKYHLEGRQAIRKEGFGLSEWRGIDYVILPPAAAAYVYYRGFDQRLTAGDVRVNLSVDPLSDWIGFRRNFVGGLTVEVTVRGCPVGLVASFGVSEGEFNVDFVGLGTGVDIVRKALALRGEQP